MGSMITSQNGILSASEGQVTVTINNETVELQLGQTVPAGAKVLSNEDVSFVITFDDGTIFNSSELLAMTRLLMQHKTIKLSIKRL